MQNQKSDGNQQQLLFLLIIGLAFYIYLTYFNVQEMPSTEAIEKAKTEKQDLAQSTITDSNSVKLNTAIIPDTARLVIKQKEKKYVIENNVFKLRFTNKGGLLENVELKQYKKYDSTAISFMKSSAENWDFQFNAQNQSISNKEIFFETDAMAQAEVENGKQHQIKFTSNANGLQIEHMYTITSESYYIDYKVYIDGKLSNDILFAWNSKLEQLEKSFSTEQNMSTNYYKLKGDDEVDYLSEMGDDVEDEFDDKLEWIAHKQQFFARTFMYKSGFSKAYLENKGGDEEEKHLKDLYSRASISIDPMSSKHQLDCKLYFGPLEHKTLSLSGNDHENIIPLGWPIFRAVTVFFISPVFGWLESYHINYGLIILILAILIKLIVSPLTYKTYSSQIKMKMLKDDISALKEKHKDDNQKFSQAQMALYSQMGVSPLSGCIPMLLQMPILFAMFRFFPSSIQLRQQAFLWADDLSSYDSILNLPFDIPFYGAHVSLFTILMTITSVFYTRMNSNMMDTGADNPMASQMKMMQYFMPIMFLGIFNNFSSALSYYYLLFNLLSFAQQFVLKKFFIDEAKITADLAERRKRPASKSKFQQRLETYMKEQAKKK